MTQSTAAMITCGHCGRAFAWKPAIAGKKGKCSCGQVLNIPVTPPTPPPPVEDDLEALYEMAEPAPDVLPAPTPIHVPRPATSLTYAPPPRVEVAPDALTDPVRDIYVPTGLLVVGFLTILIGVTQRYDWPPTMLAVVSLIQGAITAVKTLIIIGLAIVVAPALGISFGLLRTAVLKFAGILIFTDAALLLLEFLMESTGAISPSGRRVRGVGLVNLMAAAAVIGVLTHYLFDMDSEETGKVAIPMAIASRLIEIGMNLLLIFVILPAIFAPKAAAPAAAAPAGAPTQTAVAGDQAREPTGATAVAPAPPVSNVRVVETAADQAIAERIAKSPLVQNALESRNSLTSIRGMRSLLDGAQACGASRIHIDLEGNRRIATTKAYIELPTNAAARAECYSVVSSVCQTYGHSVDPAADANQRYLTVLFKQR
jgi:hypothetical protein